MNGNNLFRVSFYSAFVNGLPKSPAQPDPRYYSRSPTVELVRQLMKFRLQLPAHSHPVKLSVRQPAIHPRHISVHVHEIQISLRKLPDRLFSVETQDRNQSKPS
jgi:hypothetical protein